VWRLKAERISLALFLNWLYATTLGLLYAAHAARGLSTSTLMLPGVVAVALMGSAVLTLAFTPFAVWALRTGTRNLSICGSILWIAFVTYTLLVPPVARDLDRVILLGLMSFLVLGSVLIFELNQTQA
jgi:hypothetical protein